MKLTWIILIWLILICSASKSPYADILEEYVQAERAGKGVDSGGPGECWPYMKDCPKSLFLSRHNVYSSETDETLNEIPEKDRTSEVVYKNLNVMWLLISVYEIVDQLNKTVITTIFIFIVLF